MDYKKLNKKAMTCMYVKTGIVNLVFILITVVSMVLCWEEVPTAIQISSCIFLGILVLYALFAPKLRYESYRYRLTEEEFAVRKGLLNLTTEIVPIERLHKIEVSSGPIFRAFGLKEIKVTTAGGEIKVSYLENTVADKIAEHLKRRINTIAVEERAVQLEEEGQPELSVSESEEMNTEIPNGNGSQMNKEGEHGGE